MRPLLPVTRTRFIVSPSRARRRDDAAQQPVARELAVGAREVIRRGRLAAPGEQLAQARPPRRRAARSRAPRARARCRRCSAGRRRGGTARSPCGWRSSRPVSVASARPMSPIRRGWPLPRFTTPVRRPSVSTCSAVSATSCTEMKSRSGRRPRTRRAAHRPRAAPGRSPGLPCTDCSATAAARTR